MNTLISTPSGRVIVRVELTDAWADQWAISFDAPSDAVAVFGAIGDWAAYAGDRARSDDWLRDNGLKLRADEAATLFPFMNIGSYRP